MNFQDNLFGSSSWSLMQLTGPKNVDKVTQVFLECTSLKNGSMRGIKSITHSKLECSDIRGA